MIVSDRVFDGVQFLEGTHAITFSGPKIDSVRRLREDEAISHDAFDLRGKTVMPGMINVHAHIARGGAFEPNEKPAPKQMVRNFRDTLRAGVTTVADMGCTAPLIDALRALVADNPVEGPSILASGPLVTAPEGYPLDWMPPLLARAGVALPCANDLDAERAVGRIAQAGMDHVKMAVMHQSYAERPMRAIAPDVARAVVKEAHRQGLRVLAHAHSAIDYRVALEAGVDALMHSSFVPLDAELVARVKDAGIVVCPTLWVFESACLVAEMRLDRDEGYTGRVERSIRDSWRRFAEAYEVSGDVVPEGIAGGLSKARARDAVKVAAANLVLLRDAGVPIAFGNDANFGFSLVSRPFDEISAMHRAGMSTLECLRACTSTAAQLLGRTDRGRLAPGLRADAIAVDGDPEASIDVLGRVTHVFSAGVLVREPPSAWKFAGAIARGMAGTVRDGVLNTWGA